MDEDVEGEVKEVDEEKEEEVEEEEDEEMDEEEHLQVAVVRKAHRDSMTEEKSG